MGFFATGTPGGSTALDMLVFLCTVLLIGRSFFFFLILFFFPATRPMITMRTARHGMDAGGGCALPCTRCSRRTVPTAVNRESARVRGKTPEGMPMEDPEEAFNRRGGKLGSRGTAAAAAAAVAEPPRWSRIPGDVSMAASNASEDGTLRLRQVRLFAGTFSV